MHDERVILLVEDNADDEALTLRALNKNRVTNKVVVARDGVQAVDYLFGTGSYAGRDPSDLPRIVLLDLKLPRLDGFEVLERLRGDAATRHIPVIILTNYGEPELRERGLRLGALEFLVKGDTNPAQLSESVERSIGPRALPST